jgi:hypothetical protein
MFGALEAATRSLIILGLLAFVAEAIIFRSKTILLSSGLLVYAIATFAIWLWLRNAHFFSWDDFSHWGLRTKDMMASGSLYSIIMLQDYPPGANLFHYFCLWPIGMSEGGVFAANGWILATPLPMLVRKTNGSRLTLSALTASSILYLCYTVLGVGFLSASVDSVLTAMFAGVILSYFVSEKNGTGHGWLLLPLAALPLIKHSGLLFALTAAGAIAVDLLFFSSLPSVKHRVGLIVAMILLPLSIGGSWQLHVQTEGLRRPFPVETLSLSGVLHEWFYSSSVYTTTVVHNFIFDLATRDVGLRLPTVAWLCLFGVLSAVLMAVGVRHVSRWRLSALVACLSVGFVVYLVGLLMLYTFFLAYIPLPSFERYVGSYLSVFFVILSFFLFLSLLQRPPLNSVVLLILVALIASFRPPVFHFPKDEFLLANQSRLDAVKAAVPPDAIVRTISQGDNGGQLVRVRYALSPRQYSGYWSLGIPYKEDDIYTQNVLPEELKKIFLQANFIFLLRVDDNFWTHYASLFDPGDARSEHYLYRVVATETGDLKLVPVL